jgi:hypothetical protein
MGVGETGVGETGVGEMGVGKMEVHRTYSAFHSAPLTRLLLAL